ncbi:polar amino acid transport system substrate-binding protein [Arthrobacter sp. 1088]|uniref:substrate-binding periplasmic protein n=1 Tax=Arthrobacter sp. 1088 TaxID=2817768 RepID=UPI00285956CD|nr:transporter substrate-binding domain-containing protein [Arthrobacter sp. 1088]MDR6688920.1 polar amino acid transport system substrate-binding protein [Arthrobacter sp. 1088]
MKALKRTACAILAAGMIALTGCSSTTSGHQTNATNCKPAHDGIQTITPGVLTVAHYEYPPFAYVEDGKLKGLEGEVLQKIADMECLKINVVPGDSAAMITSVQTGRADTTLGSWYRTKARSEVVRLSEPVVTSPLALVSKTGATTVDDLTKLGSVGAGQALVGVGELKSLLGDRLKLYPTNDAEFADFQAGRIQAIVLGYGAAITSLKKQPVEGAEIKIIEADSRLSSTVNVGQTNFPTKLNNNGLGQAIDEDIKTLRNDGAIADIAKKYGFQAEIADPGTPNLL